MEIRIRKGEKKDLPNALELIKELAFFEKAPHEVENSVERMEEDGFGSHPVFSFIVAEAEENLLGISIFYFRYSTWKGKCLYLEDLIVTENERRKGIGKQLFEATLEFAKNSGCKRISWQVLDWNESAINFYKKFGANFDPEWVNGSIIIN